MTLSPKPFTKRPLKGWKELDSLLQSNFTDGTYKEGDKITVNLDQYSMTYEEIENEALKNGYKVEHDGKYTLFS